MGDNATTWNGLRIGMTVADINSQFVPIGTVVAIEQLRGHDHWAIVDIPGVGPQRIHLDALRPHQHGRGCSCAIAA